MDIFKEWKRINPKISKKSSLIFFWTFSLFFFKAPLNYAKLKYSRVPRSDTSATLAASLFAGIYGYIVCEKAGFELLDSADFSYGILYIGLTLYAFWIPISFINLPALNFTRIIINFGRSFV